MLVTMDLDMVLVGISIKLKLEDLKKDPGYDTIIQYVMCEYLFTILMCIFSYNSLCLSTVITTTSVKFIVSFI